MSNQDATEPPMNEVLASIRNILQENKKPYHPSLDKGEYSDPFNRMPAKAQPAAAASKSADDSIEREVNTICRNINRIIQKPEITSDKVFSLNVNNHKTISSPANQQFMPQNKSDTSSLIVRQFNTFFAERRNKNPHLDNTISNVAQTAVINEVVPVLQQWIDECLPSIIRGVIAKAGPR